MSSDIYGYDWMAGSRISACGPTGPWTDAVSDLGLGVGGALKIQIISFLGDIHS